MPHVERLFERVIRGEYDYDRDIKNLERYLNVARKADCVELQASILNVVGVLNNVAGHVQRAIDTLWDVHTMYLDTGDMVQAAHTLSNLGFIQMNAGNYSGASSLFKEGMAIFQPSDGYATYRYLLSNQLHALLMLEDYAALDTLLVEAQEIATHITRDDAHQYARHMGGIYRIMAERELIHHNFDEARRYAGLARDLAEGSALTFELGHIYCTCAHIELAQTGNIAGAMIYWQELNDLFDKVHAPAHIGRNYLEEARYLLHHDFADEGRKFAERALAIFEQNAMVEDAALAHDLLAI